MRCYGDGGCVTRSATYLDSRLEEMWNIEDVIRPEGRGSGWAGYSMKEHTPSCAPPFSEWPR